jgi:hypothetical protein
MVKKEPYGMEKDLKVLKGKSGKHSARLEGQFLGLMPAPDLEVFEEEGRRGRKGLVVRGVKDPRIRIDLDVKDLHRETGPFREMLHLIGLGTKEGNFEVVSTMDRVLRALSKAKFKNMAELKLNGKLVYDHPEKEWDLREVLKTIKDLSEDSDVEMAEARVLEKEVGDLEALIKVDRVHTEFTHDIDIEFSGEMDGEMLRRVINYLEDNLEIEELIQG